jgi:hypothetical protein
VAGPQQVGDVAHGRPAETGEHVRVDVEEFPARRTDGRDPVRGQHAVRGVVLAEWQEFGVAEFGHGSSASMSSLIARVLSA